mmetsp:Transcript_53689/g.148901  ORF Transcript_53689/g.148901 Transcript_53689/m.148901 type:complete len:200 (-) Transcript_53689:1152-1751(-)
MRVSWGSWRPGSPWSRRSRRISWRSSRACSSPAKRRWRGPQSGWSGSERNAMSTRSATSPCPGQMRSLRRSVASSGMSSSSKPGHALQHRRLAASRHQQRPRQRRRSRRPWAPRAGSGPRSLAAACPQRSCARPSLRWMRCWRRPNGSSGRGSSARGAPRTSSCTPPQREIRSLRSWRPSRWRAGTALMPRTSRRLRKS